MFRFGGNKFHRGDHYPPWKYPLESLPDEQNITIPPTAESSAIETYPNKKIRGHKRRRMGAAGTITVLVGCGTLLVAFAAIAVVAYIRRSRLRVDRSSPNSLIPVETISSRGMKLSKPKHSGYLIFN